MRDVVLPHLTASPDAWSLGEWQQLTDSGPEPLGERVDHWDYSTPLELSCDIGLDVDQLRAEAGLVEDDELTVACFWESTSTGIRRLGYSGVLPAGGVVSGEASMQLDGSLLGGSLKLFRQVILTQVGQHSDPLAADHVGSIILSEPREKSKVVALEGNAARFPTEMSDFSAFPIAEPDALWYLDIATGDLDVAALAAMRLYLNSSHPAITRALDPDDPIGAVVRSTIRWDVARTIISYALRNPDFIQGWGSFEDDSLGAAIENLIRRYWPGETAQSLRERERAHPTRFQYQLQGRMRLMAEHP